MVKLKLLSELDLKKSEIFKKMGCFVKETAFSIIRKNKVKNDYIGWAAYSYEPYDVKVLSVGKDEKVFKVSENNPLLGLRPVVDYSEIKDLCENKGLNKEGVLEVDFGEYPQTIVEGKKKNILKVAYLNGELQDTGKKYKVFNKDVSFSWSTGPVLNNDDNEEFLILNELIDDNGDKYVKRGNDWFKVEPIKWLVDEENNFAITESILTGGLPFGEYEQSQLTEEEREFERKFPSKLSISMIRSEDERLNNPSIIEGFLNVILSKDIIPSELRDLEKDNVSSLIRLSSMELNTIIALIKDGKLKLTKENSDSEVVSISIEEEKGKVLRR